MELNFPGRRIAGCPRFNSSPAAETDHQLDKLRQQHLLLQDSWSFLLHLDLLIHFVAQSSVDLGRPFRLILLLRLLVLVGLVDCIDMAAFELAVPWVLVSVEQFIHSHRIFGHVHFLQSPLTPPSLELVLHLLLQESSQLNALRIHELSHVTVSNFARRTIARAEVLDPLENVWGWSSEEGGVVVAHHGRESRHSHLPHKQTITIGFFSFSFFRRVLA